jgi:hypothetical protein
MRVLPLREVHLLLKPSSKRSGAYGREMSGWQLKLAALAWAKCEVAEKKAKRIEAFWGVADVFGLKTGVKQPKSIWVERS